MSHLFKLFMIPIVVSDSSSKLDLNGQFGGPHLDLIQLNADLAVICLIYVIDSRERYDPLPRSISIVCRSHLVEIVYL